MAVSEAAVKALAFCEQTYFTDGLIPSVERISQVVDVSVDTVKEWFKSDTFREALQTRGVKLTRPDEADLLSFQQLNAANLMLNIGDKRSNREKLEEIGATTQQWNSWMRDANFANYMKKRAEQMFASGDSSAYLSVLRGMEAGDLNSTKLYFEMKGIYNPKVTLEVNVDAVLMRVVEIIQRHVKDPVILQHIADDIEGLEGVRRPELPSPTLDVKEADPFAL